MVWWALGIIALGEEVRWWHMAITWEPHFLMLMLIGFAMVVVRKGRVVRRGRNFHVDIGA